MGSFTSIAFGPAFDLKFPGGFEIVNITPSIDATPGSPGAFSAVFSVARLTPIEFDLIALPADTLISIMVKYPDRNETYVALDFEGNFLWPFDVDSSITPLDNEPVHVVLLPRGGWRPGVIAFQVAAVQEPTPG